MFIGVDGCKGGWIAITLKAEADGEVHAAIYPTLERLWQAIKASQPQILIDMPIGLPESSERATDTDARRVLGARRSSIFSVPVRRAVYAETYAQACEINAQLVGKKFALQFWHIAPKVREVDMFLREHAIARSSIQESHPEVLFWGLNGGQPLQFSKKSAEGWEERLAILQRHHPSHLHMPMVELLHRLLRAIPRHQAARDDLVDACVLAVAAKLIATAPDDYPRLTMPSTPITDSYGLPMQIVYTMRVSLLSR